MEGRGRGEALGPAALREAAAGQFLVGTLLKFPSEERGRRTKPEICFHVHQKLESLI